VSAGDENRELFSLRVTGPAVTEEVTREVGEAAVELFDAVAEQMGMPRGQVRVGEVVVGCDGDRCVARRPWTADAPGWVRTTDGRDYCPACWSSVAGEGEQS
jgi:hypothetical protein